MSQTILWINQRAFRASEDFGNLYDFIVYFFWNYEVEITIRKKIVFSTFLNIVNDVEIKVRPGRVMK